MLKPGDIVILGDLGIHQDAEFSMYIRGSGARVEFLSTYSPDLNPIENTWSKAKARLRASGALQAITPTEWLNWFSHCDAYMCS